MLQFLHSLGTIIPQILASVVVGGTVTGACGASFVVSMNASCKSGALKLPSSTKGSTTGASVVLIHFNSTLVTITTVSSRNS